MILISFSTMSDQNPSHDSAGAIRAAGGGFAKMEIAHEEEYFYKLVSLSIHFSRLKKSWFVFHFI